jgi:hypothetical protein
MSRPPLESFIFLKKKFGCLFIFFVHNVAKSAQIEFFCGPLSNIDSCAKNGITPVYNGGRTMLRKVLKIGAFVKNEILLGYKNSKKAQAKCSNIELKKGLN